MKRLRRSKEKKKFICRPGYLPPPDGDLPDPPPAPPRPPEGYVPTTRTYLK